MTSPALPLPRSLARLAIPLLAWVIAGPAAVRAQTDVPPNVVLILLDDVGIEQLAVYDDQNQYSDPKGYPYAHTPTIDALAAEGVRFDQARTMPMCSPTRACVLSGVYPFRHGVGNVVFPGTSSPTFLEFNRAPAPVTTTLPALLSSSGYAPFAVGKWHLALPPEAGGTMYTHPIDVGFLGWEGVLANPESGPQPPPAGGIDPGYYNYYWTRHSVPHQVVGTYNTIFATGRAKLVAGQAREHEPFLLLLGLTACHRPLDGDNWPPKGRPGSIQHGFTADPPDAGQAVAHGNIRFRAALETADTQLGELLAELEPIRERTLVILMGDNGTQGLDVMVTAAGEVRYPLGHPLHQPGDEVETFSSQPYDPLRSKRTPYEAGVRVPLIVSGPRVAGPGRTSDALVDTVDLYATLAGLAEAPLPAGVATDSVDFGPLLRDPLAVGDRSHSLVEFFTPNGLDQLRFAHLRGYVRREGQDLWKLVHEISWESGPFAETWRFYHLAGPSAAADPLETQDLGINHPEFWPTLEAYHALVRG